MNCKPGDFAIFVKSYANNYGKIVRVTKLHIQRPFIDGTFRDAWEYEGGPLLGIRGNPVKFVPDEQLRPIRDNPGTDETLTWAPVPHKETA